MPDFTGLEESFEGEYGWAKLVKIPADARNAEVNLNGWLLFAPYAHPMWAFHLMYVIQLRNSDGVQPAKRAFPEATHEIGVLALYPEEQPYTVEQLENRMRSKRKPLPYLSPPDVVVQLQCTDDEARKLASAAAWGCCYGHLIPDSDGQSAWTPVLLNTLQHVRTGGHAHDHGAGRH